MIKFRPYQQDIARAIMDSVLAHKGLTFSVEIARQGGKNELSAQLEVLILTLFMSQGGNIIKCSPTFKPQTVISMQRLRERLDDWGYTGFYETQMGYIITLGAASIIFLSADASANVVGNTAHLLLEIDEAQDVSKEKYSKEFRPMGSTTNVTTVHYGTTWDDATLLEEVKQDNLERERRDGVKRHFRFDWQEIARFNPDYAHYVQAEKERLGENHPLFRTQYALLPLQGGGHFLSLQQQAQMQGEHPRCHQRQENKVYVAGVDLAGEVEELEDNLALAINPKRDATVITIAEVLFPEEDVVSTGAAVLPVIAVVEHYAWSGVKHTDLYPRMIDILKNVWHCSHITVDATGIGEPVAGFLRKSLGSRVQPFKFTQQSKSELAFGLLAAINGGRLKVYRDDGSPEAREFWTEIQKAKSQFRPSQTMNFFVDPSEGHDDYLMSLALSVRASKDYRPRRATGKRLRG